MPEIMPIARADAGRTSVQEAGRERAGGALGRGVGHGEPDDRAAAAQHQSPDRVPLALVAVEQARVGGLAPDGGGELPAEVGGVLQAGVHALAARGGVHVRRVAREEDPADPVVRGLALVAVEAGDPARVMHAVVGAEGAPGDLADLVQLDGALSGTLVAAVPADDAVPAVAEGGDEREGVADRVDGEESGGLLGRAGRRRA